MNYPLIAGIACLFFAVLFSIFSVYEIACTFYAVSVAGIFIGMLNDKKVEDNG